jgi:hypothetical protein
VQATVTEEKLPFPEQDTEALNKRRITGQLICAEPLTENRIAPMLPFIGGALRSRIYERLEKLMPKFGSCYRIALFLPLKSYFRPLVQLEATVE